MCNIQNNNREQIITLLDKAEFKIQIAVSWLTDEVIINKLIELAPKKKIDVLLSCDPLNVWRFASIIELKKKGAMVLKTGKNVPGIEGFMHAKFMIIDDEEVYGGSFNFTQSANFNYENFARYDMESSQRLIKDFKNWWSTAKDYTDDFEDPNSIKSMVVQGFQLQEKIRENILGKYNAEQRKIVSNELSEREALLKDEIEKDKKRMTVGSVRSGVLSVSNSGVLTNQLGGVKSKPHRYYGGKVLTKFNGQKLPNSYALAFRQMNELKKKYSFLQCKIENDVLICHGVFQPEYCKAYKVRIEFRAGCFPQVYILTPRIVPNNDIHIFQEGSLCLFYPGDLNWKDTHSIAEYTIPWIFEWILFYEIYLLTGIWEGEFVPHKKIVATIDK